MWDSLTCSNIASTKNLEFSECPPYRVLVFPISGRIFAQVLRSHPEEYLACTLTQTSTFHIGDVHLGNSALKEGERTIEPHENGALITNAIFLKSEASLCFHHDRLKRNHFKYKFLISLRFCFLILGPHVK